VDHLSGFAHIACCHSKSAEEIGIKLVHIFSRSITPKILKSENGTKFVGDFIKFFGYIHIVKGCTCHPQMQGKIECSIQRGIAAMDEPIW
jgi:hypothetical protein